MEAVNAHDIADRYAANEVEANRAFMHKKISISGIVFGIKNYDSKPLVYISVLGKESGSTWIERNSCSSSCWFTDSDRDVLAEIKQESDVIIEGFLTDDSGLGTCSLILERCKVLSVTPPSEE